MSQKAAGMAMPALPNVGLMASCKLFVTQLAPLFFPCPPRPRRARCLPLWAARPPGAAGSTALCPTGGDATSARQLAASKAAVSYSALCAEANASSIVDGAEPSSSSWISRSELWRLSSEP